MNIKGLLEKTTGTRYEVSVYNEVSYLNEVRTKLIGASLRKKLGLDSNDPIEWEKVKNSIEILNNISVGLKDDFYVEPTVPEMEKYLRYSVMEDIEAEFKNQSTF